MFRFTRELPGIPREIDLFDDHTLYVIILYLTRYTFPMLPFFSTLEDYLGTLQSEAGFRIDAKPVAILGLAIFITCFLFMPQVVNTALSLALFIAPVWVPFMLATTAWALWLILRRSEFIASQKHILLEIKPPRSIEKTPLAMEAVLSGIHLSPGEATWYKKYILGAVRPWWSLEIVSLEGQVHFYIWTRAGFRRIIETQIYAQYPGAQVVEVPDYTRLISAKSEEWGLWGCQFVNTKPDPFPIKTYVEYGLDKVQKEHEQVDPLSNLIEFMGSMGKGEYLWLQYIIRVHKGEKFKAGVTVKDPVTKKEVQKSMKDWKEHAKMIVAEIRKETREPYKDSEGNEVPGFPNPTKGQLETIAAIERNVSKLPFDIGIRGIYLANPGKFDGLTISALTGVFKQFSSEEWNGFKPSGGMTQFDDYPWEIGVNRRKEEVREGLVDAYRRRQFFHPPHNDEPYGVMSTEELATIYHIPSGAVTAPGLPRIESATSEAPVNLPT